MRSELLGKMLFAERFIDREMEGALSDSTVTTTAAVEEEYWFCTSNVIWEELLMLLPTAEPRKTDELKVAGFSSNPQSAEKEGLMRKHIQLKLRELWASEGGKFGSLLSDPSSATEARRRIDCREPPEMAANTLTEPTLTVTELLDEAELIVLVAVAETTYCWLAASV
jgi:hypothetical protein